MPLMHDLRRALVLLLLGLFALAFALAVGVLAWAITGLVRQVTPPAPVAQLIWPVRGASALLLTLPAELREFIPSRLFEYMASGAPILALVPPDSVAARMVLRSRTGTVVDIAAGVDEVAAAVHEFYVRGRNGTLSTAPDWEYIRGFSSRAMAGRWAALLNGLGAGERVQ